MWTEKLSDPFLGWSVPVYGGCPNIHRYFPEEAVVRLDMNDVEGSLATISRLLENAPAEYERRFDALQIGRQRVLDDYNITTLAERLVASASGAAATVRRMQPNEATRGFALANYAMRARRLIYRRYFLLTQAKHKVTFT